jgi:hypothetical protein
VGNGQGAFASAPPRVVNVLATALPTMLAIWTGLRLRRRALERASRRELFRMGLPVCPDCGYPLDEAPPARHQCPECGFAAPPAWHD